jgi:hypothetical protein
MSAAVDGFENHRPRSGLPPWKLIPGTRRTGCPGCVDPSLSWRRRVLSHEVVNQASQDARPPFVECQIRPAALAADPHCSRRIVGSITNGPQAVHTIVTWDQARSIPPDVIPPAIKDLLEIGGGSCRLSLQAFSTGRRPSFASGRESSFPRPSTGNVTVFQSCIESVSESCASSRRLALPRLLCGSRGWRHSGALAITGNEDKKQGESEQDSGIRLWAVTLLRKIGFVTSKRPPVRARHAIGSRCALPVKLSVNDGALYHICGGDIVQCFSVKLPLTRRGEELFS